jgi:DNA topoisomerase-6 subunit A
VQQRELFNLNQAVCVGGSSCRPCCTLRWGAIKDLIDADKTSSLRGVFYKAKHTVAGTKENTFDDQGESDPILEDLEVGLDALREELHVFAEPRGGIPPVGQASADPAQNSHEEFTLAGRGRA